MLALTAHLSSSRHTPSFQRMHNPNGKPLTAAHIKTRTIINCWASECTFSMHKQAAIWQPCSHCMIRPIGEPWLACNNPLASAHALSDRGKATQHPAAQSQPCACSNGCNSSCTTVTSQNGGARCGFTATIASAIANTSGTSGHECSTIRPFYRGSNF